VSGTPTVKLDGDYQLVGGMTTGNKYIEYRTYFDQRKSVPSPIAIELACSYDSTSRSAHLDIKLRNETGTAVDGQLQVALCENHIYNVWGNLDSVQHVTRTMLPSAAGEAVSVPANDSITRTRDFTVDAAWVARDCEIVVFVQNTSSRTIVQGAHIGVYQVPQLEFRRYAKAYPEPGGDADLTVFLRNIGTGSSASVCGVLSTTDPHVTVTTPNADFGSIAIAQDVGSATPFAIHVDAGCPDNHLATMDLAITGAGGYTAAASSTARGYADDMENGENGWTHSGLSDNWHQTPNRSKSPANSWYCGTEGTYQYTNQNDAKLMTPFFNRRRRAPARVRSVVQPRRQRLLRAGSE
jgi:hypothetical protein